MLLDSTVLVDQLRGYPRARSFLYSIPSQEAVFVSVISEAELFAGKDCEDPERQEVVKQLLSQFQSLPVDSAIARKAGSFRRNYGVPVIDSFIAATAFVHRQELYSHDLKEFSKIKEISVKKPY